MARRKRRPRRFWTAAELVKLEHLYPDTSTKRLARIFHRPVQTIYSKAIAMGLRKSAAYLASPDACRLRRGDNVGGATRFKKGMVPHNKGLRRPGWHRGRMRETQFKKGRHPPKWCPIGTERIRDGYLCRKITDTGYPPRDWRPVQLLLWEEAYGPVPKGHAIVFVNGNRKDIRLDNLAIASRADLMRRNSYHNNYPPEIRRVIQLRGALVRVINGRERKRKAA